MNDKLKVLGLDIETSPSTSYLWSLWSEINSYDFIQKDFRILCFSAKWLGEKKMISSSLVDFPNEYKKNPENDKLVLEKLWKLMDEADIIYGHNIADFDIKKINARFIINGMLPPSSYRTIDTLLACRRYFGFMSNKLNDVSQMLGLGKKKETGGFKLWKDCLLGDKKAWNKMVSYCKNDVVLLEKVYLKLRPYILQHPHMNIQSGKVCCPKCCSEDINFRGYSMNSTGKFKRFVCKSCGGWGSLKINELSKEDRKVITKNG